MPSLQALSRALLEGGLGAPSSQVVTREIQTRYPELLVCPLKPEPSLFVVTPYLCGRDMGADVLTILAPFIAWHVQVIPGGSYPAMIFYRGAFEETSVDVLKLTQQLLGVVPDGLRGPRTNEGTCQFLRHAQKVLDEREASYPSVWSRLMGDCLI